MVRIPTSQVPTPPGDMSLEERLIPREPWFITQAFERFDLYSN